jgi:hypothetical protein
VLDVRLYGIRDMPTFKERPPVLPQSVLSEFARTSRVSMWCIGGFADHPPLPCPPTATAKLRGLDLYDINSMMRALEPQTGPGVEEHAEDTA